MSNSITVFNFETSKPIRLITINNEPWFVAKDVAEALDYTWNGNARIAHIPSEWRGVTSVVTPYGTQQMAILSEHGLYFFLNRSDKPKALPFQKKVAGEILPQIRKTGHYTPQTTAPKTTPADLYAIKNKVYDIGGCFHCAGGGA